MQWRKRTQLADRAFAPFSQKTRQWMLCMCVCQPLFIFSIPIINLSKWMNASGTIWDKAGRKKYVVDIFLRFYVSWKYFSLVFKVFFKVLRNGISKITEIIFTQNMWFPGPFKLPSCSRCLVMGNKDSLPHFQWLKWGQNQLWQYHYLIILNSVVPNTSVLASIDCFMLKLAENGNGKDHVVCAKMRWMSRSLLNIRDWS